VGPVRPDGIVRGVGNDSYYDILGLSPAATTVDIKARYRQLILRIHPDLDGPPALFRQVQEAYEVLSDPVRRVQYDRLLESRGGLARTQLHSKPGWDDPSSTPSGAPGADRGAAADSSRSASSAQRRNRAGRPDFASLFGRHPAIAIAIFGALLLVFGAALTAAGTALFLLGALALIFAGVAGLGGRGVKEREAFRRSGMTAVDAMTGRQFEVLLEHFFANKGYRVARIGGRGDFGADLLLYDANGRIIVQARQWHGEVRSDAVQRAIAAMARYGAARGLVVTSSNYSQDAVTVAKSNGITLWNRADLAAELTMFRGNQLQSGAKRLSSEVQAGLRICLGFVAAMFVALVTVSTQARRSRSTKRSRG
jgi:restriction system protein